MDKLCPISGPHCKAECTFMRNGQCDICTIAEAVDTIAEKLKDAVDYLGILAEEAQKPTVFAEKEDE